MSVFPTRPGQVLAQGDARAAFVRVFSGEVITQFEAKTVMLDLHQVRTISAGRSARFPILGQLGAQYHQVGQQILGAANETTSKLLATERNLEVDNLFESHVYIADYDEAMRDYDLRSIYSREMSAALSRGFDQRTTRVAINAARQGPVFGTAVNPATGVPYFGGSVITDAGLNGTPNAAMAPFLRNQLLSACQAFDEKFVPEDGRVALMRPDMYWLLIRDYKDSLDKDWGGSGSLAQGSISMLGGLTIKKSTNMPIYGTSGTVIAANHPTEGCAGTGGTANLRAPVGTESGAVSCYTGDFAKTRCLVFTREAIGTVKLRDLRTEDARFAEKKANFLGVDYMMGHGILRPECAIEIAATATS